MGSPKKEGSLTVELLTRFKNKKMKKKILNQRSEKRKRRKSQSKIGRKQRKKEKFPIKDWKKTKAINRKVFGPDNI